MQDMTFTVGDDQKTLIIERSFQAPRSKVWAAWTTPELFAKWWGPRGWSTNVKRMDFTPGGVLLYGMTCEDPVQTDWYGKSSWSKSVYETIDAENSFDYTDAFSDENGTVNEQMPIIRIRLEFIEQDGATLVRSTAHYDTAEDLQKVLAMGMEPGTRQTWDRLAELLS